MVGSLPSGTVTFLFTDIEGSTKLARSFGDKWEPLCTRHHEILKKAIESNNGYIFQIIGDAFCAAFHNAQDGFEATVHSQIDLQKENWGDVPVRVRMGLHTGKADVQEDGQYQGYLVLSQVQRIMDAGHGGQVLLSGVTENLLRGSLPEDIDLLDLGRHNFKGVPQAVRVFQMNAPDLERDFPPLRTFDILPNNLPAQLTSFVGREKALSDVKRLLSDTHMLTLIGPGGTGKTRLSIQAGTEVLEQYPDGVWLVDLAPILDPMLVPRTTAVTIGLRSEPKRPVIDMLCDYLSKKKMLIILDNCEHLVEACAQMADRILHAASKVQILASSREALGIAGEVTYRVPSLGLPDVDNLPALESLSQYEAVKLFIDRAAAANPDFKVTNENAPALAQICHRLDGIPLAIELAAGKIRVLGLEQISKRLDDRFKLLTGGSRTAMERHQTLRAAVDWSYNLLPPEEQTLFRRLAIFLGGWTLEAAEAICGENVLELLEQLINKSLVVTEDEGGKIRYRMLETIRQYANEKLVDVGESKALRERHLEFFLDLAETAEPHLYRHEQLEWLAQLDADYENLRAALDHALGAGSTEPSLRLCAALGMFWYIRGYWIEGSKWLEMALVKPTQEQNHEERAVRVKALYQDADLAEKLDDLERMANSAKLSLALAQQGRDVRDIAIARFYVAFALYRNNKLNEAHLLMEQSLTMFRSLNDSYWEAFSFSLLGRLLEYMDKHKIGEWDLQSVELARKAGERLNLAEALCKYADAFYNAHKINEWRRYIEEADRLYKLVGSGVNRTSVDFGKMAWLSGNYEEARSYFLELRERYDILGEKMTRSSISAKLGRLALEQGDIDQAQAYFEEALTTTRELKEKFSIAVGLAEMSDIFYLQRDFDKYKQTLYEGIHIVKTLGRFAKTRFLLIVINSIHLQKPRSAASLLGIIYTSERDNDQPILLSPLAKRSYYRTEAYARDILGDAAFESAFAEGQKMSLDESLDLVWKIVDKLQ